MAPEPPIDWTKGDLRRMGYKEGPATKSRIGTMCLPFDWIQKKIQKRRERNQDTSHVELPPLAYRIHGEPTQPASNPAHGLDPEGFTLIDNAGNELKFSDNCDGHATAYKILKDMARQGGQLFHPPKEDGKETMKMVRNWWPGQGEHGLIVPLDPSRLRMPEDELRSTCKTPAGGRTPARGLSPVRDEEKNETEVHATEEVDRDGIRRSD